MIKRVAASLMLAASILLSTACSHGAIPVPASGNAQSGKAASSGQMPHGSDASVESELGMAGPDNFEVLGLGSPTNISITGPSSVRGNHPNVGVAGASQFSMSDGVVQGQVILSSQATTNISGPSKIKGGVVVNDPLLNSAVPAALTASQFFESLPATSGTPTNVNISNPSGNLTITGTQHTTVVDLADLILNGGSTLTLFSPKPTWQFVINITGRLTIQGGSRVVTQGLNPPHVVFNVLGAGQDVAMGGGTQNGIPTSQLDGILLVPQRNIALSPGLVRPEVIGGGSQITITSGGEVLNHD